MSQQDDLQYDEDDAVKFIRNFLPGEVASKFSDDDINYVIDLIYEFYESKGYMDENNDSEVDIIEDELTEYVITNARKNGFTRFDADDVSMVVQGELEYCDCFFYDCMKRNDIYISFRFFVRVCLQYRITCF